MLCPRREVDGDAPVTDLGGFPPFADEERGVPRPVPSLTRDEHGINKV